jgi:hypothetical protein
MSKRFVLLSLVASVCAFVSVSAARADVIRVTAGFTSFSGVVLGQNSTFFDFCPGDSCGGPPSGGNAPICPDAGCDLVSGVANVPISGNPASNRTNQLDFYVSGNERNELDFRTVGTLDDASPVNFKLGTLTFTNGTWTGDAKFGFSIVAHDSTINQTETFSGFINMTLTDNTGSPAQNADYIYITDALGQPVAHPLTLLPLPSLRAYEEFDSPTGSNTVSVDLFGRFGSLDLTELANVVGGGFLDVSLTPELGGPPATQVPEPGTLALLAGGALGLILRRRTLVARRLNASRA